MTVEISGCVPVGGEQGGSAVVIGAGPAGLAAGYRLSRDGWRVTVLEKEDEPGGRCRSVLSDGFLFDTGAQQCKDSYDAVLKTVIELGVGERFRMPGSYSAVLSGGRHYGFLPRSKNPRRLLPWASLKKRCLLDALAVAAPLARSYRSYNIRFPEWWRPLGDESAGEFFKARVAGGFAGGLLEAVCIQALGTGLERTSVAGALAAVRTTFADRPVGFTTGMSTLPLAIASRLEVSTGMEVESVTLDGGTAVGVKARTPDGDVYYVPADAVVCAVPGPQVKRICPELGRAALTVIDGIEYSSSIVVNMAFHGAPAVSYGTVLVPPSEGFMTSWACAGTGKASEYSPQGMSVVTSGITGGSAAAFLDREDDRWMEQVFSESARIFGFATHEPVAWRVDRHPFGRPVVAPGHARRVGELMSAGSGVANLALAGDWTASPTVEGAVTSGFLAAAAIGSGALASRGKGEVDERYQAGYRE